MRFVTHSNPQRPPLHPSIRPQSTVCGMLSHSERALLLINRACQAFLPVASAAVMSALPKARVKRIHCVKTAVILQTVPWPLSCSFMIHLHAPAPQYRTIHPSYPFRTLSQLFFSKLISLSSIVHNTSLLFCSRSKAEPSRRMPSFSRHTRNQSETTTVKRHKFLFSPSSTGTYMVGGHAGVDHRI